MLKVMGHVVSLSVGVGEVVIVLGNNLHACCYELVLHCGELCRSISSLSLYKDWVGSLRTITDS